ncbi:MAG: SDR family NAD(P)-dependent oxidoreductase [Acidimicrobiales bacterium]
MTTTVTTSLAKTVLITGAGSGFGKGAALVLAGRGHTVIAAVQDEEQRTALATEAPALSVVVLDVTEAAHLDRLDSLQPDVLIANAAVGQTGPLSLIPLELVRRAFEVNVFGTLAVVQRVAAGMRSRRSGRILIVSSIAGRAGGRRLGPVLDDQARAAGHGRVLRNELAPFGVDVALINPVPTPPASTTAWPTTPATGSTKRRPHRRTSPSWPRCASASPWASSIPPRWCSATSSWSRRSAPKR